MSALPTPSHPWKPPCRHCHETKDRHASEKCLFNPTTYEPMTWEDYVTLLLPLYTDSSTR